LPSSESQIQETINMAQSRARVNEPDQVSHFLRIAAELRLQIYECILPFQTEITFDGPDVTIEGPSSALETVTIPNFGAGALPHKVWNCRLTLMLLNKQIHREAAAVLYGSNKFTFYMGSKNSTKHRKDTYIMLPTLLVAPRSPYSGVRLIKRCEIIVRISDQQSRSPECWKRLKAGFSSIVDTFGTNENDHALQELRIRCIGGMWRDIRHRRYMPPGYLSFLFPGAVYKQPVRSNWYFDSPREQNVQQHLFLEPLTKLKGVKRVFIDGIMDEGFVAKLAKVMTTGLELNAVQYGNVTFKRRRTGYRNKVEVTRSKKCYYDPDFDWESVELDGAREEAKTEIRFESTTAENV
jgi:hypothetical protein